MNHKDNTETKQKTTAETRRKTAAETKHKAMEKSRPETETRQAPRTPRQIAALVCVILLAAMYLVTFLVACLDFPGWNKLFAGCLLMTIALPILLWLYIWLYGIYTRKHTMASLDMMHSDDNTGIRADGHSDARSRK